MEIGINILQVNISNLNDDEVRKTNQKTPKNMEMKNLRLVFRRLKYYPLQWKGGKIQSKPSYNKEPLMVIQWLIVY